MRLLYIGLGAGALAGWFYLAREKAKTLLDATTNVAPSGARVMQEWAAVRLGQWLTKFAPSAAGILPAQITILTARRTASIQLQSMSFVIAAAAARGAIAMVRPEIAAAQNESQLPDAFAVTFVVRKDIGDMDYLAIAKREGLVILTEGVTTPVV